MSDSDPKKKVEHDEHTKKLRRKIEETMRQEMSKKEIEALYTILKVDDRKNS